MQIFQKKVVPSLITAERWLSVSEFKLKDFSNAP